MEGVDGPLEDNVDANNADEPDVEDHIDPEFEERFADVPE